MLAFAKIKSMAGGLLTVENGSHWDAGPQRWHQPAHTQTRSSPPGLFIRLCLDCPHTHTPQQNWCLNVLWHEGRVAQRQGCQDGQLEGTVILTKLCWTSGTKQYWFFCAILLQSVSTKLKIFSLSAVLYVRSWKAEQGNVCMNVYMFICVCLRFCCRH